MFQLKRFYATLVLGAAVPALFAAGAQDFDRYDTLKRDMVHAAKADAVLDEAALQSLHRAALLNAIEVDSTGTEPTVILHTSREVPFDVVFTADGKALSLRLHETILSPECKHMVIDGGNAIGGVTASLVATEPNFVSEVRLNLTSPVAWTGEGMGQTVQLTLHPAPTQAIVDNMVATEAALNANVARAFIAESAARSAVRLQDTRAAVNASLAIAAQRMTDTKLRFLESDLSLASAGEDSNARDAFRMDILLHETRLQEAGKVLARVEATLDGAAQSALAALNTGTADAKRIRTAFENEMHAATNSLHELYNSFDAHLARIDVLAAQLPNAQSDPLAALDNSMASLRSDAAPAQAATPLDELSQALHRVREQAPGLAPVQPAQFAMLLDDEEKALTEPPGARITTRDTATAEVTGNTFQRTEVISASQDVLRAAEAAGAIVIAQAETGAEEPIEAEVISDSDIRQPTKAPTRVSLSNAAANQPPAHLYNPTVPASQDPLRQPVNIDFQEMDLSTVVGLLARKAQINVIADEKVEGSVTANLQGIPLGRAIEVVLRMNNLGIVEEEGVYRITSYEEAIAARRDTRMIPLENAQATEVAANITDLLANSPDAQLLSVSASGSTNHLILTGPIELIRDYEAMAKNLDIAPQVVPTVTKAIKLNYSSPEELLPIITALLGESGRASGDLRGRHLVITDIPIKVEEITALITELDVAVRQVNISAMIVDAVLSDNAQTGIDWTLNAIRRTDRDGNVVSNLSSLATENDFTTGPVTPGVVPGINLGSQVLFGILSGDFNIQAAIAGEVASNNGELLANPTIVTLENKPASISISEEVPYQELTQSLTGPPIATTEFKEIGTLLEVTTRVTHDDHVIVDISAKQSDTKGESVTGVPIEDKREADTSLRVRNGQTIFIGGLRRFDDELSVRKTPILGDIPVLGFLFRNQNVVKDNVELLIFLTCNIMPEMIPELTPSQKTKFDQLGSIDASDINASKDMVRNYLHPDDQRDPIYKWRRSK